MLFKEGGARPAASPAAREHRLETLYARWDQFAAEYDTACGSNDQETMTNLRGLLLLIKKEIVRLAGKVPAFPGGNGEHHLADL